MFDVFRRHQKRWLTWVAGLIILSMFAFSFPTLFRGGDGNGRPKDRIVDTFFGQEITQHDLRLARDRREIANNFVVQSMLVTGNPYALRSPEFARIYFGFGPSGSEESIKNSILLSCKADQLGITVGDDFVRNWITSITEGKLSTQQFKEVLNKVAPGMDSQTLFELLRRELRIRRVQSLVLGRFAEIQITPYEAWQFYRRLNDRIGLELVAVPVANFTEKVADPGEQELRKLYEKYVNRLPDTDSPEPGFKEPRRANLHYAHISLEAFALAMKPEIEVTEEEIRKFYEERKELYRVPASTTSESSTDGEEKSEESMEAPPEGSESPDKPQGVPGPESSEDKKNQSSSESPDTGDSPNESPKPSGSEKEAQPEGTDETQDPPAPNESPDNGAGDRLDEQEEAAAKSPAVEAPTPEKPQQAETENGKIEEGEKSEAQNPAEEDPATEKPGEERSQEEMTDEENSQDPKKQEAAQYKSLEEVTPEIHDRLMKDKAREILLKQMEQVQQLVNLFADKEYLPARSDYEEKKEKQPGLEFEAPEPPDLTEQITELGLLFAHSGLVTEEELSKVEGLGESVELVGESSSGRSLTSVMTGSGDDLYDPREFRNFKEEYYTVWKVDDQPAREPRFPDIRDQVLAAYRAIHAREHAKAHAEELAESLREHQGDLAKLLEENPGLESSSIPPLSMWSSPPQFSFSTLDSPSRVIPTTLPNVRNPGVAFRTQVFGMQAGDIAVSANQPEDTFYVIKVAEREPSSFENFAKSRSTIEDQLVQIRAEEITQQWTEELRQEASRGKAHSPTGN